MMRIFISYGHDSFEELPWRIKRDLEQRGHECWFDRRAINPGADRENRIADGLGWCAAGQPDARFLLLMTEHSVRRPDLGLIRGWVSGGDEEGLRVTAALIEQGGLGGSPQAILATQLARIHSHRGEYEEARRWLDHALARPLADGGQRTRAIALHERGSLSLYERNVDVAVADYHAALQLCLSTTPPHLDEASANRAALATALTGLGAVAWHEGATERGQGYWRAARKQAERASPRALEVAEHNVARCMDDSLMPPR